MDGKDTLELVLTAAYLEGARDGFGVATQGLADALRGRIAGDGSDRGIVESNLLRERAEHWAKNFVRQHG